MFRKICQIEIKLEEIKCYIAAADISLWTLILSCRRHGSKGVHMELHAYSL